MSIVYSSKKLKLTESQIEDICNSIPINKSLPEYIGRSIINNIRMRLYNELSNVSIYPEMYSKFKDEIVKYYYKSLAEGGLACGIMASTSLGERQTQSTLNTFHAAGLSVKTVVVGVPRFSELLNATKSPKMVNCLIYLNDDYKEISDIRRSLGNSITDITFKKLVKSYELIKDDPLEEWHYLFCSIYDIKPSNLGWRLRFHIDISVLYEYRITMKIIAKSIMEEYADSTVLYTPDWKGILDVFVDESCFTELEQLKNIFPEKPEEIPEEEEEEEEEDDDEDDEEDEEDEEMEKLDKSKKFEIKKIERFEGKEDTIPDDIGRVIHMEDKILPSIQNIRISGIPNIKDIFFEKRKDEWIISTEGSNLYGLFSNPLIDKTRTLCNDMWEIYSVFGIEAARQFLVEEYMDVVSSDGSFVNSSHVELLVDIMVYTGSIISISRYGQKKVGCGPMAKASFEESLENFLKAGINGEKETTNGVSASIMLGKMPQTGTGVFDMYLDIPKIINSQVFSSDISNISNTDKEEKELPIIPLEDSSKTKTKYSLSKKSIITNKKIEEVEVKEVKEVKETRIFKKNPFFDDD
jgi:DNA-directed RNA polymerase beta' subunit